MRFVFFTTALVFASTQALNLEEIPSIEDWAETKEQINKTLHDAEDTLQAMYENATDVSEIW